jgi:hypothetical protein
MSGKTTVVVEAIGQLPQLWIFSAAVAVVVTAPCRALVRRFMGVLLPLWQVWSTAFAGLAIVAVGCAVVLGMNAPPRYINDARLLVPLGRGVLLATLSGGFLLNGIARARGAANSPWTSTWIAFVSATTPLGIYVAAAYIASRFESDGVYR